MANRAFPSAREAATFQKRYRRWLHRRLGRSPGGDAVLRYALGTQPVVIHTDGVHLDDPAHRYYSKRVTAQMERHLGYPLVLRPYPLSRRAAPAMNVPQLVHRAALQRECWPHLRPNRDYPWEHVDADILATWLRADALLDADVADACLDGAAPDTALTLAASGITYAEYLTMDPSDRTEQITLLAALG